MRFVEASTIMISNEKENASPRFVAPLPTQVSSILQRYNRNLWLNFDHQPATIVFAGLVSTP